MANNEKKVVHSVEYASAVKTLKVFTKGVEDYRTVLGKISDSIRSLLTSAKSLKQEENTEIFTEVFKSLNASENIHLKNDCKKYLRYFCIYMRKDGTVSVPDLTNEEKAKAFSNKLNDPKAGSVFTFKVNKKAEKKAEKKQEKIEEKKADNSTQTYAEYVAGTFNSVYQQIKVLADAGDKKAISLANALLDFIEAESKKTVNE